MVSGVSNGECSDVQSEGVAALASYIMSAADAANAANAANASLITSDQATHMDRRIPGSEVSQTEALKWSSSVPPHTPIQFMGWNMSYPAK